MARENEDAAAILIDAHEELLRMLARQQFYIYRLACAMECGKDDLVRESLREVANSIVDDIAARQMQSAEGKPN